MLVNYLRDYQIGRGVEKAAAYDQTMYILAGLLVLGFIANLMVRPVAARHFRSAEQLRTDLQKAHEGAPVPPSVQSAVGTGSSAAVVLAWIAVGIPFAWGVWNTLLKAWVLFR